MGVKAGAPSNATNFRIPTQPPMRIDDEGFSDGGRYVQNNSLMLATLRHPGYEAHTDRLIAVPAPLACRVCSRWVSETVDPRPSAFPALRVLAWPLNSGHRQNGPQRSQPRFPLFAV